ncbi:hypothetical protein Tco_0944442 [Tanacetum coccineum]
MQDCKPISTPFPTNVKLSSKMSSSSKKERMEMSRVSYASAVGSLMFMMICTRPDIAHAVGVVSRYIAEPGRGHWEVVKRIIRYIKGTSDVALCFGDLDLCDLDESKSTAGYVFTLSGRTVSWVSKLQSVVAMSTTEVEYVAAAQASNEAVWNPTFHSKTKHIRVQYHFVREKVEEGTVDMQKIYTDDNVADYLTKAINCDKFIWCRSSCGLAGNNIDESNLQTQMPFNQEFPLYRNSSPAIGHPPYPYAAQNIIGDQSQKVNYPSIRIPRGVPSTNFHDEFTALERQCNDFILHNPQSQMADTSTANHHPPYLDVAQQSTHYSSVVFLHKKLTPPIQIPRGVPVTDINESTSLERDGSNVTQVDTPT